MPSCFVPGCKSGYISQANVRKCHFFHPPKNKLEQWDAAIPRKDKQLTQKSSICDLHFKEEFLIKSDKFIIKNESVELPRLQWKLHKDAVPHLFPNLPKYLTKKMTTRKPPVKRLPASTPKPEQASVLSTLIDNNDDQTTEHISTMPSNNSPQLTADLQRSKQKCRFYKKKVNKIQKQKFELQNQLERISKDAKEKLDLKSLPPKQQLVVKTIMQRQKCKSVKGMRYKPEYILESLLFWIKSPKGYNHCANHGLLPLPKHTTLQKLYRGIKCGYGINTASIDAMQNIFKENPHMDKSGILVFDELKLRQSVSLNTTDLKFDGFVNFGEFTPKELQHQLANHALVFIFVPFLYDWMQPVAVYASFNSTPGDILSKILLQVIQQLENAGANIVGFTCDGSTANKKAWKHMGISGNLKKFRNSIPHPFDPKRRLYAFTDPPHIIKCIRNNLQTHQTCTYKGKLVDYAHFVRLYINDTKQGDGKRVVPKLTQAHITPNGFQKMSVKRAVNLFSRSVATGLQLYRKLHVKGFEGSEGTESFTREMNWLFDALNSKTPVEGLRKNSTTHLFLKDFQAMLSQEGNDFASKQTLESLRVTIQSVLELAEYLWDNGYKYLLTAKLNQDPVERHFGIIRGLSYDDHPSTIDFLHLHLLQSIYIPIKGILSSSANCEDKADNFLTAFTRNFKMLSKESQKNAANHKMQLRKKIGSKLHCSSSTLQQLDHDYRAATVRDSVVYFISGFVVRHVEKFTTCHACCKSLTSQANISKNAIFVALKDYGEYLTYPSDAFVDIMLQVEGILEKSLQNTNIWEDLFAEIIDSLDITVQHGVCCSETHMFEVIPGIILYYLQTRCYFRCREMRQELTETRKTIASRKLSKL